jgi:hypothetical protein
MKTLGVGNHQTRTPECAFPDFHHIQIARKLQVFTLGVNQPDALH